MDKELKSALKIKGQTAGVLWLDTNGELHFTDQAGTDHVISWKG